MPGEARRVGRGSRTEIPGARLVVLERTSHDPHLERPAAVVDALERFLTAVETGSTGEDRRE